MTTLTTTSLATLPRVNLLPPEIAEERRFRRVQAALALVVAGAVAAVGVGFLLASGQVSSAQDELDAAKAKQARLQNQANEYAAVPAVYAQVDAAEAQLELAMGKEVRWSYFLNDVALKIPNRVWLTKINVAQVVDETPAVAPSGETTPYSTAALGTVELEGMAYGHRDVAAWLDMLAKQQGVAQPYFTKSEKNDELDGARDDTDPVKFASQVTITRDALSGRYTNKAGS